MSHPQSLQYSIIRTIRRKGKKPVRFYAKDMYGRKVFGFWHFQRMTKRMRKAGLEFKVVHHLPRFPNDTHVSPHFTWAEFASNKNKAPCCDTVQVPASLRGNAVRLARGLEMLRHLLGDRSLSLLSVYRTKTHNDDIGGAQFSQHVKATAADIDVPSGQQARVVAAAKQVPQFKGIGIYPSGGVHVDVRAGRRVFWNDWGR